MTGGPVFPLQPAEPGPSVGEFVQAYVRTARRVGYTPTSKVRSQVGQSCKRLLGEGKSADVMALAVVALAKERKPAHYLDYVAMDAEYYVNRGLCLDRFLEPDEDEP